MTIHARRPCVTVTSLSQKMIEEMTHRLVKLIRGALLPTTLPPAELSLYGGWENKAELTGAWLTQVIHTVRYHSWQEHIASPQPLFGADNVMDLIL